MTVARSDAPGHGWFEGKPLSIHKYIGVIAATAIAYFLLFQLNELLFSGLRFSDTVNWIFLPSGLRLAFVLIFVEAGAIGIVVATSFIGLAYFFNGDVVTALGAGVISGFAPWMARLMCLDVFRLDVNLKQLDAPTLLKMSVLFAVLSPILHQVWFTWRGLTQDFISSTVIMVVGDWVGTMVVLYSAKFLLFAYRPARAE